MFNCVNNYSYLETFLAFYKNLGRKKSNHLVYNFSSTKKIAKYTNLISWLSFYTQLRKGVRHNSLVGNFRRWKQMPIIFLRKILKINKPLLPNKKKQMGSGEWLRNGLDEITFVIRFLKWWCTYLSTYSKETNIYSKTVYQWELWIWFDLLEYFAVF